MAMRDNESGLSRVAGTLGKMGSKVVAPDTGTGRELSEKMSNIDQYRKATRGVDEPTPARRPTSAVDKINPGAKYGDRPGEQRIDTDAMVKPLPSYEEGTDEVPEDGPAMLHKGEAVLNKDDAADMRESKGTKRVSKTMGGAKPKKDKKKLSTHKGSKKKVHKITAHKGANGGVTLEHEFEDGSKELHHHPDFQSASDQMKEHLDESPEGGAEEGSQGAAPDAAGPAQGAPQGAPMASPGSFKDGGVVEKSGMAMVHKGETVIPAKKPPTAKDQPWNKSYIGKVVETQPKAEPDVNTDDSDVDSEGKKVVDRPSGNTPSGRDQTETGVSSVVWGSKKKPA